MLNTEMTLTMLYLKSFSFKTAWQQVWASISKSYYRTTLYIYLFFYFFLLCWMVITGVYEITVRGEGIYRTIVELIIAFLFSPILFIFPFGASFIYSHILYQRKRKNLFAAWILSFTVVPASLMGASFCRFSFEPLFMPLGLLLLTILGISLFYSKIKWLVGILFLYTLYLLLWFLAEFSVQA